MLGVSSDGALFVLLFMLGVEFLLEMGFFKKKHLSLDHFKNTVKNC
jgi:hypothetical protein